MLLTVFKQCLAVSNARDYFKLSQVHWLDSSVVKSVAIPSKYACVSQCSSMGANCTVFEFQDGTCTLGVQPGLLWASDLANLKPKSLSMVKRGSSMEQGRCIFDILTAWLLILNVL